MKIIIFCTWKLYKIKILMSIIKILLEHSCTHVFTYCLSALMLQWQIWVVSTKTGWPQSLSCLPSGLYERNWRHGASCKKAIGMVQIARACSRPSDMVDWRKCPVQRLQSDIITRTSWQIGRKRWKKMKGEWQDR